MKRFFVFSVLFAFVLGINAFAQDKKTFSNVDEMTADAKKSVKVFKLEDLKKKVDAKDSSFYLIDVRDLQETNTGRIPQGIPVSRGTLELKLVETVDTVTKKQLKKSDLIVVYCQKEWRAILAAESLVKLGYTNVYYLEGGVDGWTKAGNKLDRTRVNTGKSAGQNLKAQQPKSKEEMMKMREEMMKKRQEKKADEQKKNEKK